MADAAMLYCHLNLFRPQRFPLQCLQTERGADITCDPGFISFAEICTDSVRFIQNSGGATL